MKKLISIVMCFILINSMCFAYISDIQTHWAYEHIVRNVNNEYINGYPDNTFKPDDYIKENEFIKILVKIMENSILPLKQEWDKPFIEYAIKVGLINNEEKDYNKFIKREDCFEIIYNFLYINLKDIKDEFNKPLDNVEDKIDLLYKLNIVNGYPDNTLKLENNITRAETTKLINKTVDYIDLCIYENQIDLQFFNTENIYDYTNYTNKNDNLFLNNFKISNNKVLYNDLGRYSKYTNKYIDKYNNKVIDILLTLINKNNYVVNTYLDEQKCIIIGYGEKKEYVYNNNVLFEVILYEDTKSLNNNFKYNVKINVYQLWKELNEIKQDIKINKYYLNKLLKVLDVFIIKEDVNKINNFIIQSNQTNLYNSNSYIEKIDNCIYIYINI